MTKCEFIKNKIASITGDTIKKIEKPAELTFLSNEEKERRGLCEAYRVWYSGDSNKLLDYYTGQDMSGFLNEPIYNRNKANYFWGLSAKECDIKRVHSGMPKAIIDTLSNVVGKPKIAVKDYQAVWDEIAEFNDLYTKVSQQSRPLTFAQGYGAWKINFDKALFNKPTWEYFTAENVEYISKYGVIIGFIFQSYYKDLNDNKYLLMESRFTKDNNSYITYDLFKITDSNNISQVGLDALPDTKDLQDICIPNLNMPLAIASVYFYDSQVGSYGKSILEGKLDLFDEIDEALSDLQLTIRVSPPAIMVSKNAIPRGANGETGMPNRWNKQFIEVPTIPNGDGTTNNKPVSVDQPNVTFQGYIEAIQTLLNYAMIGNVSPATLGFDVAKKDNAEAQREKEKVTIVFRGNVIAPETRMWKKFVDLSLITCEYMATGNITNTDYETSVEYNEFANPSFENTLNALYPAWSVGALPTREYATILWGDKKTKEELEEIISELDSNREVDLNGIYDTLNGRTSQFEEADIEEDKNSIPANSL